MDIKWGDNLRISSLIELLATMIAFGIFFYFIEPMLAGSLVFKFLVFALILITLRFLSNKLDGYFEFWDRRIDKQLSIWIVIGLIFAFLFIGSITI